MKATRTVHPLVPLAFLMAALAAVQAYFLLLLGPYGVLSADNIDSVLMAWRWARRPTVFISDSGWLPFYFWVYGAVLRFWADPMRAPVALTLFFSGATVAGVFGVSRRLGGGTGGSLLAAAAAGFIPEVLKVGLRPYFDPLFSFLIVSALYAWLRSEDGERGGWQALSAALWAAAAFTRFEGWIFAAVWFIGNWRCRGRLTRVLALVPIFAGTAHHLLVYHRLQFLSAFRDAALFPFLGHYNGRNLRYLWEDALQRGTIPLAYLLLRPHLKTQSKPLRDALALAWVPLGIFGALVIVGGFPLPPEHVAPFIVILLPPLAPAFEAALRSWGGESRRGAALAAALAAVMIGGATTLGVHLPAAHVRVSRLGVEAAGVLHGLRDRLAPEDGVLYELPLSGKHEDPEQPAHADPRLAQLAMLPREVKFDRPFVYAQFYETLEFRLDAAAPSLLDAPPADLRAQLERRKVRLVLALSPRESLRRAGWAAAGPVGRHTLYLRAGDPLR